MASTHLFVLFEVETIVPNCGKGKARVGISAEKPMDLPTWFSEGDTPWFHQPLAVLNRMAIFAKENRTSNTIDFQGLLLLVSDRWKSSEKYLPQPVSWPKEIPTCCFSSSHQQSLCSFRRYSTPAQVIYVSMIEHPAWFVGLPLVVWG